MDLSLPVRTMPGHPPTWSEKPSDLPAWTACLPPRHVHVVPSLSLGGAERIVTELAATWAESGIEADVAVMRDAASEHRLESYGVAVHRLGGLSWPERLAYVAGLIRASRLPAYCHLTSLPELEALWKFDVPTVPVVHNASAGWKQEPQAWNASKLVPYVVACGDQVAGDLRQAGLLKPVRVLRHLVRDGAAMDESRRMQVRTMMGASEGTVLIGMTGRMAVQKRYTRAVRVLSCLVGMGVDARLSIVGAAHGAEGMQCLRAVENEAVRLGMRDRLYLAGPVQDAGSLVPAYDVFLNTSLWEGVSISTMEAVAAGVPVVAADVGGQREAVGVLDDLMESAATDRNWAEAVLAAASRRAGQSSMPRDHGVPRAAVASMWPWMLVLGPGATIHRGSGSPEVLFVTGNMDVGGAQRSLCNLVAGLARAGTQTLVAVAGPVGVPGFMEDARREGVEFIDASGHGGPLGALRGRMGRILNLVAARTPRAVCFWNMDAYTKVAVAKVLQGGPVRVVDVSPGPMLYKELDAAESMARLLSTGADAYVGGLDLLVSKYAGGGVNPARAAPLRYEVIPNGVPLPSASLLPGTGPEPPYGCDPSLAVVTVGRLVAAKRPELLPLVAIHLEKLVPGATLTVVGGMHGGDRDGAWNAMAERCSTGLPGNLYFAGPDSRATGFLPRFACFYMVSQDQGCPNASLEAMACGLPVVANPDGGTVEQVVDDVTGFLVADPGDEREYARLLASALSRVLLDPVLRLAMGEAGRQRAAARFSMDAMCASYAAAFSSLASYPSNQS